MAAEVPGMTGGAKDDLKLIYVIGFPRSGTTILGNLLGELEGFVHVGELYWLWRRAALSKDRCGCGKRVETCSLWSEAMAHSLSRLNGHAGTSGASISERAHRAWDLQRRAESTSGWRGVLGASGGDTALVEYAHLMENLLEHVAQASNARVIVDSSKLPRPAAYLKHLRRVRPYFLHVIRDSRGAVFSRQRRHARQTGGQTILSPITTVADCFRWMRTNAVAGFLGRTGPKIYKIMRYEDFVSDPSGTLLDIAAWVDERPKDLPLVGSHQARLGPNHTVCGNRNRFDRGDIALSADERWKFSLRTRDYAAITALTAPLLARYGYGWRRRPNDSGSEH